MLSIGTLVLIDLSGLAGSLYLALVLRELYYGERPILWGLPWDAEQNWLPFLMVVTVLVFWRAGLYAPRESRAGAGRIVSSLLLVTVITLAFSVGTGYQHSTFGLYLTGFVLAVVVIGLLRSSYELVTADLWRVAGVRRRALLVGDGERLDSLRRAIGRGRSGIDYEFVGDASVRHEAPPATLRSRPARAAAGRAHRQQRRARARRSCSTSSRRRTGTASRFGSRRRPRSC